MARKINFETGNYYHIFNRGVDRRDIFKDEYDFVRMIRSVREFNNGSTDSQRDYEKRKATEGKPGFGYPKPGFLNFLEMPKLVEIICYCLNKNHYHFLFKQLIDKGIEKFMHKLGLGYTKYYNYKHNRKGRLFEDIYQAAVLNSEGKILRASAYINGNPEIHKITKTENWPWSSYRDYLGLRNGTMCNKDVILNEFKSIADYREFVKMIITDERKIKEELAAME